MAALRIGNCKGGHFVNLTNLEAAGNGDSLFGCRMDFYKLHQAGAIEPFARIGCCGVNIGQEGMNYIGVGRGAHDRTVASRCGGSFSVSTD
jgi:hypothetical protein